MPSSLVEIVVLETTIDHAGAQRLLERVERVIASSPGAILLDLTTVAAIDPVALPVFLQAIGDGQSGTSLTVVASQPHIRTLLLGAREFGSARLVATRSAAIRALKST